MRLAVVIAHPDDESIGMGGTLALLARQGHEVQVVVTTTQGSDSELRKAEMLAATRIAGLLSPRFLDMPELALAVSRDVETQLHALIGDPPDAIFTLWSVDVHPDHRNTGALTIGRYLLKGVNTELFAMETCSAGRSSPAIRPQSLAFCPTHYVDVSSVLDTKYSMLACHVSQDPAGMWRGAASMMKNRGAECGFEHAEAFIRLTRVGPTPAWLAELLRPTAWVLPRRIAADFDAADIGL